MKRLAIPLFLAVFLLSAWLGAGLSQADAPPATVLAYLTASDAGSPLAADADLTIYAHLPVGWLIGAESDALPRLAAAGFATQALGPLDEAAVTDLYVVHDLPGQDEAGWERAAETLVTANGWRLIRVSPSGAERLTGAGAALQRVTADPKPASPRTSGRTPTEVVYDPAIQAMMDQVLSDTVTFYDGGLSGEWPVIIRGQPYTIVTRYTYSGEPIQKAVQYVGDHFAKLGLGVEYHTWSNPAYPNVIGEIPGLVSPEEIYIFSAHLDDAPSYGPAPGADDNASGTAAAMIAAEIFSQYQWACTLRFGVWTGEEQGLLGSHAYAQRAYNQGENIAAVLNLDMIGWNSPGSPRTIDLHAKSTMPGTVTLAHLFDDVVDVYGLNLIPEIVLNGSGASDHASFWQYGYPAILGIEDFADFNPYYHTSNDRLSALDIDYFTTFVKASVGAFAHMSDCLYTCDTVEILDVATTVDGCVVAFDPDYAGTAPIAWDWSFPDGVPASSTDENPAGIYFGASGTYTYTVTATNCAVPSQDTYVDTVTVACDTCTPVGGASLEQLTPVPIYPDDLVAFTASITPTAASRPYSYTVAVDGAVVESGQSTANALAIDLAFEDVGDHTVTFAAWNCDMAEPVTASLVATVAEPYFWFYQPVFLQP